MILETESRHAGDGLRADKLFQLYDDPPFPHARQAKSLSFVDLPANKTTPAPYLRSRITSGKAGWGISQTRVPTESRPGHVAMIAGMYEDVSAVTKGALDTLLFPVKVLRSTGWKSNPVGFDSVLNQSTHAWGFGSPDIVPMFADGATPGKVNMWCYAAADEDFTAGASARYFLINSSDTKSADATKLDTWVLDRIEDLFRNASTDSSLASQLRQPGNLFFLHLLGLDTTGHGYRPHGIEYYDNIVVVDDIVRRIEELFDHDGRTAFVFTADHGMSNIGNHGDGDPDNTRTPLVVWGSGVKASERGEKGDEDAYSADWALGSAREDVEQADVAALMVRLSPRARSCSSPSCTQTALIGRSNPGNSVGRLPVPYLDASPRYKAEAALANAQGILEQYEVKRGAFNHPLAAMSPF